MSKFQEFLVPKTMDSKALSLMKLPSRMEPFPSYDEYVRNMVSSTIPETSSHQHGESSGQQSESMSWDTDDDPEITLYKPSRSMNTQATILRNQEILFQQQQTILKRQKRDSNILKKIWKKLGCSSSSSSE